MTMKLSTTAQQRRELEQLDSQHLGSLQLGKLNALMEQVLPRNKFYARKLAQCETQVSSLDQIADWPYTFKEELVGDLIASGFATNLTLPIGSYSRFHRTSGTRGRPMVVLDTNEDWQWWIDTWQFVLDAAEIVPEDRIAWRLGLDPSSDSGARLMRRRSEAHWSRRREPCPRSQGWS